MINLASENDILATPPNGLAFYLKVQKVKLTQDPVSYLMTEPLLKLKTFMKFEFLMLKFDFQKLLIAFLVQDCKLMTLSVSIFTNC